MREKTPVTDTAECPGPAGTAILCSQTYRRGRGTGSLGGTQRRWRDVERKHPRPGRRTDPHSGFRPGCPGFIAAPEAAFLSPLQHGQRVSCPPFPDTGPRAAGPGASAGHRAGGERAICPSARGSVPSPGGWCVQGRGKQSRKLRRERGGGGLWMASLQASAWG